MQITAPFISHCQLDALAWMKLRPPKLVSDYGSVICTMICLSFHEGMRVVSSTLIIRAELSAVGVVLFSLLLPIKCSAPHYVRVCTDLKVKAKINTDALIPEAFQTPSFSLDTCKFRFFPHTIRDCN